MDDTKNNTKTRRMFSRIWKILQDAPAGISADEMAEKAGITPRTAYRYLREMRELGQVRKVCGPGQKTHYALAPDVYLPPVELKRNEVMALAMLCCDFAVEEDIPLLRDALPAFQKLVDKLPDELRRHLRKRPGVAKMQIAPLASPRASAISGDFYEEMLRARESRREVSVDYDSFTEREVIQTIIRPYALRFHRRAWYCIGHSSLHGEVRTFHMGRVRRLEILEKNTFLIPPGWSVEDYLGNAWSLINEGTDHTVQVRFQPLVARNVADVCWHKTQRCAWHEDGSMDFFVTVSSLLEIQWWILGYADQAEVVSPQELRKMVKTRIARMGEIYGE